ncbi:MAG: aromatic acid exporter family protein, partial [bacterium]
DYMKRDFVEEVSMNTVKVAGAAIIAIYIAKFLQLDNGISAGIVAILTIQKTKKETLKTAFSRFLAFLTALIIAYLAYHLAGYTLLGFCIYLFFFILVCQYFNWIAAMAMDSVLISHFIGFQSMSMAHVANEFMIFFLGIGAGIIANLNLRKDTNYIEALKEKADMQIKKILHNMSAHMLVEDKSDYNSSCFNHLSDMIREAENMALINYANQFGTKDTYDLEYIKMRKKQNQVLLEMYKIVRSLYSTPDTVHVIADYIERIATEYDVENDVEDLLDGFYILYNSMQDTALPDTRDEFEDRALLYMLLKKIEEFLLIKAEFIFTINEK